MVRHNARKKKIWLKKFSNTAAISRKTTVKNIKKGISEVVNHKRYGTEIPKEMLITSPYSGIQYVMTNPHIIHGEKYDVTVTGYDWVPIDEYKASTGILWEHKKYPQPKRLHKKYKKKYYFKGVHSQKMYRKVVTQLSTYAEFKNFPYTLPKMNKVQYMEKLTQHKLAKWDRKNPKPNDELFNDVEQWKQERETALERFRDFVVSIYDKLKVTATIQTPGGPPYKDITIGTVKDTGDTAKTVEMANNIVKHARTIHKNILHAQLLNHKKNNYRLLAAA